MAQKKQKSQAEKAVSAAKAKNSGKKSSKSTSKNKTVEKVKLLHIYNREYNRFEIDLPVKFVSNEHDADKLQMLLVRAENKKTFIISRFADGHIQLSPLYLTKFLNWKYLHTAHYNITDPAAEEKVRKLLDVYCKNED